MSSLYLSRNTPETSEHMKLVKGDAYVSRTSIFKITRLEEELITAPLFSLSACETLNTDRLNSQHTLDGKTQLTHNMDCLVCVIDLPATHRHKTTLCTPTCQHLGLHSSAAVKEVARATPCPACWKMH